MAPKTIYFCRHGATEWSESGQHTGNTDLPLLESGIKQAQLLKPILSKVKFEAVYSSPLIRAQDTAKEAGFTDYHLSDALIEWDYGDYEGKKTVDIRKEVPNWNVFDFGAKNGEDAKAVTKRCQAFLNELDKKHSGNVLCFSSGHITRAFGGVWIGFGAEYGKHLALSTASLSILAYEHEWRVLKKWNDTSHYE